MNIRYLTKREEKLGFIPDGLQINVEGSFQ